MRLGVDFSEHGGALAPATVECWKNIGVDHAVVQYSGRMDQQLEALAAAGLRDVEGYVYLYWGLSPWGQTPQDRTRAAIALAGGRIRRLWLDAEDTSHPYDEGQLAECARICEEAGMPAGIYTGRWWWPPQTGDSAAFAHLPLWHAEYLGQAPTPDLSRLPRDFDAFRPYGGWTKPAIWQWWNTTTLCGHSVDLNAIPEEESMIRHNAVAAWFDGKTLTGDTWMLAAGDLALPAGARRIRLECFVASGILRAYDGDTQAYAGQAGWGGVNYGTVDVGLSPDGQLLLRPGDEGPVTIARLGCVGFWR